MSPEQGGPLTAAENGEFAAHARVSLFISMGGQRTAEQLCIEMNRESRTCMAKAPLSKSARGPPVLEIGPVYMS